MPASLPYLALGPRQLLSQEAHRRDTQTVLGLYSDGSSPDRDLFADLRETAQNSGDESAKRFDAFVRLVIEPHARSLLKLLHAHQTVEKNRAVHLGAAVGDGDVIGTW